MRRLEYVWVARHPSVARRHVSAEPFADYFAAALKAQGYAIVRLEYEVDDAADLTVNVAASPAPEGHPSPPEARRAR